MARADSPSPTKVVGLRMPIALADEMETRAKDRGLTLSAYVMALVRRAYGLRDDTQPTDDTVKHPSGPVLADPVPRGLPGVATPNLKIKGKGKR